MVVSFEGIYQIIREREMGESNNNEALLMLQGQADVWKYMFSYADSMALRSAVELRIPDIIHRHGGPMSLSQIVSALSNAPSPNITCLGRIMRLLVRRRIFSAHQPSDGGDTLYDLTHASRWLVRESNQLNLVGMILMEPWFSAPLHYLSQCVREGGTGTAGSAFKKAHGSEIWDYALENPEFNKMFNESMECTARIVMSGIIAGYKDGFESIESLVDVGGGIGGTVSEIVKSYPHIKCINFDQPHVIATAPQYERVTHVGGDMFYSIPHAHAVFMKWILHDWSDDDCIKILKNCKKAIPEKTGKVILAEFVVKEEGHGMFDDTAFVFDLFMSAHTGGKERTELQWKNLLQQAGFPRYNIVTIPAFLSIIEAYPL